MTATYEKIETTTLGSATGTVTFSSIPATYTDLVLILNLGATTEGSGMRLRFNSDTGNNYSGTNLVGTGSNVISNKYPNFDAVLPDWYVSTGASIAQVEVINIMNYSNTTTYKTILSRAGRATSETDPGTVAVVSLWRNTNAISSIQLSLANNYSAGSTFTLYGIKAE
jgi:hypothetical protein